MLLSTQFIVAGDPSPACKELVQSFNVNHGLIIGVCAVWLVHELKHITAILYTKVLVISIDGLVTSLETHA